MPEVRYRTLYSKTSKFCREVVGLVLTALHPIGLDLNLWLRGANLGL